MGQWNVCLAQGLGPGLFSASTPSPLVVLPGPLQPCLFCSIATTAASAFFGHLGVDVGLGGHPLLVTSGRSGLATVLAGSATVRQQVLSLLSASFYPHLGTWSIQGLRSDPLAGSAGFQWQPFRKRRLAFLPWGLSQAGGGVGSKVL